MKPAPSGVIGTFLAIASVNTPTRRELSNNTKATYVTWLKSFYRYVRCPASEWTGEMERNMNFSLFKRGAISREYILATAKRRAAINVVGGCFKRMKTSA